MKSTFLTLAMTSLVCAVVAQSNDIQVVIEDAPTNDVAAAGTAEPAPSVPPVMETHITSDSVELGVESRTAVYRGHVRLEDPRILLTCEQLSAHVPEGENSIERVVAETNVVIVVTDDEGRTNRAFAEKAVYYRKVTATETNEVVELSGQPRVERPEGTLMGDTITWDRIRNSIRATNQRMVYRMPQGQADAVSAVTNATAVTSTNVEPGSGAAPQ